MTNGFLLPNLHGKRARFKRFLSQTPRPEPPLPEKRPTLPGTYPTDSTVSSLIPPLSSIPILTDIRPEPKTHRPTPIYPPSIPPPQPRSTTPPPKPPAPYIPCPKCLPDYSTTPSFVSHEWTLLTSLPAPQPPREDPVLLLRVGQTNIKANLPDLFTAGTEERGCIPRYYYHLRRIGRFHPFFDDASAGGKEEVDVGKWGNIDVLFPLDNWGLQGMCYATVRLRLREVVKVVLRAAGDLEGVGRRDRLREVVGREVLAVGAVEVGVALRGGLGKRERGLGYLRNEVERIIISSRLIEA
ncbi:hypothetical protein BJ508DRAFT_314008 [Ascobolus immersus RN42]|uniref:Uncharacterized protein n=1 Tax=Ascobolus immersus RN42 TaxID=1160509 RepID=A0A3N4HGI8_ASCIM|nr:hypothetical protein BJ508DRAFT_314008 [Ascobolus immersus RN42]